MNSELLAIIFSTCSLVGFGLENTISKKCAEKIELLKILVSRYLITSFLSFISIFIFFNKFTFSIKYILIGGLISIFGYAGYYFLIKGFKNGSLSIISTISSTRIFISVIVCHLIFKHIIGNTQIFLILMIFFGVLLATINIKDIKNSLVLNIKSGIPFALLNALIWGIIFPLYSIPSGVLGAFLFSFILELTGLSITIIRSINKKSSVFPSKKELKAEYLLLLLLGITGGLGCIFANLGYATQHIEIVSAIGIAVPVITVPLGRILYKEKVSILQLISIIIITFSIISLAYFSH